MTDNRYLSLTAGHHSLTDKAFLDWSSSWLVPQVATSLFKQVMIQLPLHQGHVRLYGNIHPTPRLQAWFGEHTYRYSGVTLDAQPMPSLFHSVTEALLARTGIAFNSVLVNLYRDGQDHMGWHSDDEVELGTSPQIASLSLGASRDFLIKRKDGQGTKYRLALEHGDLLLMGGNMQHEWLHSLPKRTRVTAPRINLTFRLIFDINSLTLLS